MLLTFEDNIELQAVEGKDIQAWSLKNMKREKCVRIEEQVLRKFEKSPDNIIS